MNAPTLPLALYAAATGLLEPLAPVVLRRRAHTGKEDTARLSERLGHPTTPRPDGPLVWLHGVSVGEAVSLLPLVEALKDRPLLVTSGTVAAAQMLAARLPRGVIHQYAPVDGPAAVARFLDHWRPDAGIVFASELWPNLILAAKARGVRLALVSARMTDASARGWGRTPATARTLLCAFEVVLPQDDDTAARLTALGARVGPRLDLKLAGQPLPCDEAELARLRQAIGERLVILAVSTHPGEDEIIAEAARAGAPQALLVIAPRHPARGPEIAARLSARLRSAGQAPDAGIYVADTLGELGLFLRLADVAVMGGSFVPGIGGHNPLEPARLGVPILTGPHVFNAADLYADLYAEAAAIEAADGAALARHLKGLIAHPHIARRMGEAGLAFTARQGAALDAVMAHLTPLLPA